MFWGKQLSVLSSGGSVVEHSVWVKIACLPVNPFRVQLTILFNHGKANTKKSLLVRSEHSHYWTQVLMRYVDSQCESTLQQQQQDFFCEVILVYLAELSSAGSVFRHRLISNAFWENLQISFLNFLPNGSTAFSVRLFSSIFEIKKFHNQFYLTE